MVVRRVPSLSSPSHMSDYRLSDNYNDLSTDSGFQFEFYCERCREGWRSEFDRYAAGTIDNVLGAAEGLFGGLFGNARSAMDRVKSAGWSSARDAALKSAVKEAQQHFHRCQRCSNYFCEQCWNADEGTCINCVPKLEGEIAVIKREAKLNKAREEAYAQATVSKAELADRVIGCPKCGAAVGAAKFCPECGTAVALKKSCSSCSAEIPTSAKFCPECGAKP
jgi:hypothetical protein